MTIRFGSESMVKQIYGKKPEFTNTYLVIQAFYPLSHTLKNTISCTSAFC